MFLRIVPSVLIPTFLVAWLGTGGAQTLNLLSTGAYLVASVTALFVVVNINRGRTARLSIAQGAFWEVRNIAGRMTPDVRRRVADLLAAARAADPDLGAAVASVHAVATQSGRLGRTARNRNRRGLDTARRALPGVEAVMLAVLCHDLLDRDVYRRLTGAWTAAGLGTFCPAPSLPRPAAQRLRSAVAAVRHAPTGVSA